MTQDNPIHKSRFLSVLLSNMSKFLSYMLLVFCIVSICTPVDLDSNMKQKESAGKFSHESPSINKILMARRREAKFAHEPPLRGYRCVQSINKIMWREEGKLICTRAPIKGLRVCAIYQQKCVARRREAKFT